MTVQEWAIIVATEVINDVPRLPGLDEDEVNALLEAIPAAIQKHWESAPIDMMREAGEFYRRMHDRMVRENQYVRDFPSENSGRDTDNTGG
jgi:hypothetical protein